MTIIKTTYPFLLKYLWQINVSDSKSRVVFSGCVLSKLEVKSVLTAFYKKRKGSCFIILHHLFVELFLLGIFRMTHFFKFRRSLAVSFELCQLFLPWQSNDSALLYEVHEFCILCLICNNFEFARPMQFDRFILNLQERQIP